jgi:hypothetical protein
VEASQSAAQQAQPGLLRQAWDNFHVGQGHFTAWLRQGFKELTHLLLPAFPAGQHIIEEPGLFGNPTQGEVARGREDEGPAKERVSVLNEEPVRTRSGSPGEIAEGKVSGSGHGDQEHGRGHGRGI